MPGDEKVKILVKIEDLGPVPEGRPAFLTHVRRLYKNHYSDGSSSRPYAYEHIHRRGYDSVAVALYYEVGEEPWMSYRPGIRIPVYFRRDLDLCIDDPRVYLNIPEAVAGSIEPGDVGMAGLLHRVAAEAMEEGGFKIDPGQVESLGGGFFPSHGQSSEKIHLCAVKVDPSSKNRALGDGSVNEADAPPILFRPLSEVLIGCCRGEIEDPKVEILASRLALKLGYSPVMGRRFTAEEMVRLKDYQTALEEGGFLHVR